MKLEHLTLSNFRGFRSFEISFDPSFTVLLGANMAGKSAVLEGATVALSAPLAHLDAEARDIEDDDIRQSVTDIGEVPDLRREVPVVVEARAMIRGTRHDWSRRRDDFSDTSRANAHISAALKPYAQGETQLDLPVVAHYATQRGWRGREAAEDHRGVGSRTDGYTGCFRITSTHRMLAGWMRKQTLVQLQRGNGYVQPQLVAVEAAVKSCIRDTTRFWYDVQYDELRLELIDGNIQTLSMLSEGVRNMVAMVADIAWRCAVLNPKHGSAAHLCTEGVVLIDELELHLHPAWQRRVVDDLQRTFPKVQFIVTTHSPQIVASVSRQQIRLLDQNRLITDEAYVEGRDTNEILEDVFGVPARPADVQAEIDAMYSLIEDEAFDAARARLASLETRLGPDDAAIIRARWLIDTEENQPSRAPAP